ncbi:MAG: lytic transglycosylase domain-containing protein [Candidatus Acidiferrum sp.]
MRLTRILSACAVLLAAAPALPAEYVNLTGGERLHVTGYQLLGDKYRLQVAGGVVEVPAQAVLSIDPEDDFAPMPPPPVATAPYHEIVKAAAARYSVDADLITGVIAAESNFNPKAVSRRNARGLMQLLPETAARFGVQNIFDPRENIDAGTHYLRDLLQRYNNDLALALAAYNAGPERVQQFGTVPPYPETVSYIRRVKRAYDKSKSGKSVGQFTDSAPKSIAGKTPPNSSRNEDAAKANPDLNALN